MEHRIRSKCMENHSILEENQSRVELKRYLILHMIKKV